MRKRMIAFGLAVLCFVFAGCGKKEEEVPSSGSSAPVKMDMEQVYADLAGSLPEMIQLDAENMLNLFGIEESDCVQAQVYVSADGLIVDEVWLLEARDSQSLQVLKDLAESRLELQKEVFESYAPEQFAVLKKGKVLTAGNYLALLVGQQADNLVNVFNRASTLS